MSLKHQLSTKKLALKPRQKLIIGGPVEVVPQGMARSGAIQLLYRNRFSQKGRKNCRFTKVFSAKAGDWLV